MCTTATETVRELPPGCYAAPFAPGKALCEAADVVVCHAGNGTIYQALSCGKPVVGVPEFHDQEFNMQRVQALGLGVRADSKDDVIRQVQKILRDPEFALRAQDFSRKYLTLWDGAANAARWIETVACPGRSTAGRWDPIAEQVEELIWGKRSPMMRSLRSCPFLIRWRSEYAD